MRKVTSELLDEMVFKLLKEIHRLESRDIEKYNLSWRDIHVLKYLLKHSPCRISDVGSELNIQLFAVSRLVAALYERGLVAKVKDDIDKRNTYVSLTPDGARMIRQVQANYYNLFTSNLELMEDSEAEIMLSSMGNVSRLLETIGIKRRIEANKANVQETYAAEVVF